MAKKKEKKNEAITEEVIEKEMVEEETAEEKATKEIAEEEKVVEEVIDEKADEENKEVIEESSGTSNDVEVSTTKSKNSKSRVCAILAIVTIILFILSVSMESICESKYEKKYNAAEKFKEEHYIEKTEEETYYSWSKGYYVDTYTYHEWDSEENEQKYDEMIDAAQDVRFSADDDRQLFGAFSFITGMICIGLVGGFKGIYKACVNYIHKLDSLYDDTAKKLIALIKVITKICCWILIGSSVLAFFVGLFAFFIGENTFYLWLLLAPVTAVISAFLLQLSTAISVMTINLIADVSEVRKKICDDKRD